MDFEIQNVEYKRAPTEVLLHFTDRVLKIIMKGVLWRSAFCFITLVLHNDFYIHNGDIQPLFHFCIPFTSLFCFLESKNVSLKMYELALCMLEHHYKEMFSVRKRKDQQV